MGFDRVARRDAPPHLTGCIEMNGRFPTGSLSYFMDSRFTDFEPSNSNRFCLQFGFLWAEFLLCSHLKMESMNLS